MGFANFHNTKMDNDVWVVSNFREVNKQNVRKTFPKPKISTVLQELEDFAYTIGLDSNIGYYTVSLNQDASKICIIVLP